MGMRTFFWVGEVCNIRLRCHGSVLVALAGGNDALLRFVEIRCLCAHHLSTAPWLTGHLVLKGDGVLGLNHLNRLKMIKSKCQRMG